MKRRLSLFAFVLLAGASAALAAQNLPTVTPERIQKLKELHQKAEQQIALNNFKGATATYQDILLFEPDDESAYANLGQIYLLFQNFDKAKTAFQNALSIDPENETALAGLEKIRNPDASYRETNPGPQAQSGSGDPADTRH